MDDNFLDLTVTSPPYNVDLGNNKFNNNPYDLYDDNKEHQVYLSWLKDIFTKVYQKTKSGGRCVINIGDTVNGKVPTHSDVMQLMQEIGWLPITTIVWNKNNTNSRTAWGSWLSPSCPSFPVPFEFIMVWAKENRKLQTTGTTDLQKQEFINWAWAIWTFGGENLTKVGHPASFPIELPMRCVKMFSWTDAIVYDPFMGAGTTAIACKSTGRNFIGSEISQDYCKLANERLSITSPPINKDFLDF